MNIAHYMARAGSSFSDNPAIAVGTETYISYGELASRVAAMAGQMRDHLGLKPGDRVALIMENCAQFLEVMYAAWHAGLCAVPASARLHPRELQYILEHSGARACFATPGLEALITPLRANIPALEHILSVDSPDYRALYSGQPVEPWNCTPDDTAWLFYTSGTTGRPKGAMLSHRNLQAMTLSYFIDVDSITPKDCIIHAGPLSHGSGMYNLPHVARAALQVIPTRRHFEPAEIFKLVAAHCGASLFAAPTMVRLLVDFVAENRVDTNNLKTIVYGGGPMYVADLKEAMERLGNKFVQIYGQGESPMTITALSKAHHADVAHPRHKERIASVGIAQTVVEVAVGDPPSHFLPPGETGEVLVRGDVVMTGYWNNPEATSHSLCDGWLRTGDVGALDKDGFLTLKDRSKDMIISGGNNIYPREVEEVLLQHEAVHEASIVGRAHSRWGEEVVAFVVKRNGLEVEEDALDRLCLERIARFKRPRTYLFVDHLPKNSTGKILKTELRKWLPREP